MLPPVSQRHDDMKKLMEKNNKLQNVLSILQSKHEVVVNNFTEACQTIETLQNKIKEEIKPIVIHFDNKAYDDENKELKDILEHKNAEIRDLKIADKMKKDDSQT